MEFKELKKAEHYDKVIEYLKTKCKLPLEKKGSTYWIRCPFHPEDTASFEVKHDETLIRCRCRAGCGSHKGSYDIFDLIRKTTKIKDTYIVANKLAKYLGLEGRVEYRPYIPKQKTKQKTEKEVPDNKKPVPEPAGEATRKTSRAQSAEELQALEEASNLYHRFLIENIDRLPEVKNYLGELRHVSIDMIKKFKIGFCPSYGSEYQGRLLVDSRGERARPYLDAGLIAILDDRNKRHLKEEIRYPVKHWKDCYGDFLAGMITFPVCDENGSVRTIQGRKPNNKPLWLNGKFTDARYWNLPDAPVSSLLYGIHLNNENIKQYKTVILVEGVFDYLALDKHFIQGSLVVSTLGSNLSDRQQGILKDLGVEHILVAYDSDPGGIKGLKKISEDAKEHVLGVILDWGQDPADRYAPINNPLLNPMEIRNLSASAQRPENKAKSVGLQMYAGGKLTFEAFPPEKVMEWARKHSPEESEKAPLQDWGDRFYHIETLKSMLTYSTADGETLPERISRIRTFLTDGHVKGITHETKKAKGYVSIPPETFRQKIFDLAGEQLMLYLWFMVRMQPKKGRVKATDREIAESLGLNDDKVMRYRKKLTAIGLLTTPEKDKKDSRKQTYTVPYYFKDKKGKPIP